jgi:hypothetical protein
MNSLPESKEQEPTQVDISTLKVGDLFTIVDNPRDPKDERYKYCGSLPGPGGTQHGFETVKTFPKTIWTGTEFTTVQKPIMWQITGKLEVIQIQNGA